jgi:hypothetical protein
MKSTRSDFEHILLMQICNLCTYFLGTTIFNSSGVSRSVKLPGMSKPGVSYRTFPSPSSILMNLRVVPGRGLVVTDPFHLFALPARFFPTNFDLSGLFASSKKLTRVDFKQYNKEVR